MSDTGSRQETYFANYCPDDVALSRKQKGGIVDKFSLLGCRLPGLAEYQNLCV